MRLEDVDPEVLSQLTHWLYTHEIRLDEFANLQPSCAHIDLPVLKLAKLWSLADRCLIPLLQNQITNIIYLWVSHHACKSPAHFLSLASYLYSNECSSDSPLRRLIIRHTSTIPTEILEDLVSSLPEEMVRDVLICTAKLGEERAKLFKQGLPWGCMYGRLLVDQKDYHV